MTFFSLFPKCAYLIGRNKKKHLLFCDFTTNGFGSSFPGAPGMMASPNTVRAAWEETPSSPSLATKWTGGLGGLFAAFRTCCAAPHYSVIIVPYSPFRVDTDRFGVGIEPSAIMTAASFKEGGGNITGGECTRIISCMYL